MRTISISNQSGQSLVQVLVSVAIMGIIMAAVAGMQASQVTENRALSEKLSALELSRVISQALAHSGTCMALLDPANLTDPSKLTFDSTSASAANPHLIPVKTIPSVGSGPVLVNQNSGVSQMAPTLFVPAGGLQVAVTGPLMAELRTSFDQGRLVRPIHSLSFVINLTTSGPANAKVIVGCQGGDRSPMINFTVAQFAATVPVVEQDTPTYHAISYTFPLASRATDQYLLLTATGVWDTQTCGNPLVGPCVTATRIIGTVNGRADICGSNQSTGSSGPYSNVMDTTASCVMKVPAGASASVTVFYDGRGGVNPNFNVGTYNTSYADANTPVLTIFSLP